MLPLNFGRVSYLSESITSVFTILISGLIVLSCVKRGGQLSYSVCANAFKKKVLLKTKECIIDSS